MPQYYSFVLLLLFYGLLVMEFFVPSGGLLAIGAGLSAISCVVVAFTHSYMLGLIYLSVVTFTTPVLFAALVRIWPRTKLGQQMLNRRVGEISPGMQARTTPSGLPYDSLIGMTGVASSPMLPSGRIEVGQDKLDAISIGGPVQAGQPIRIVDVTAGRIRVSLGSDTEPGPAKEGEQAPDDESTLSFDLDQFE